MPIGQRLVHHQAQHHSRSPSFPRPSPSQGQLGPLAKVRRLGQTEGSEGSEGECGLESAPQRGIQSVPKTKSGELRIQIHRGGGVGVRHLEGGRGERGGGVEQPSGVSWGDQAELEFRAGQTELVPDRLSGLELRGDPGPLDGTDRRHHLLVRRVLPQQLPGHPLRPEHRQSGNSQSRNLRQVPARPQSLP